jgi:hypothetical protein
VRFASEQTELPILQATHRSSEGKHDEEGTAKWSAAAISAHL